MLAIVHSNCILGTNLGIFSIKPSILGAAHDFELICSVVASHYYRFLGWTLVGRFMDVAPFMAMGCKGEEMARSTETTTMELCPMPSQAILVGGDWNMVFICFYDFPYIGNSNPNWRSHIFQRGRYTTNQHCLVPHEDRNAFGCVRFQPPPCRWALQELVKICPYCWWLSGSPLGFVWKHGTPNERDEYHYFIVDGHLGSTIAHFQTPI